MANYLTTDSELTSVADAIRTKGGTSSGLIYPAGFVSAINAIPSGGGLDYTVTFKSEDEDYYIGSVLSGGSLYAPTSPTRSGYAFGGWSLTDGGQAISFPYTPSGDTTLYAIWATYSCTVANLGSSSPSSVTFTSSGTFPTLEEVTVDGNIFIRIPTMYRKVLTSGSGQITSFTISTSQTDSGFVPYSCFLKEDGTTVMPYILIGKYMSSSATVINSINDTKVDQTISNGRTNARAIGTGYLIYDWQIEKLWQDLIICKMQTVNINSGSGITTDQLGIVWDGEVWVDGVVRVSNTWVASYKPTTYVDSATSSTTGYAQMGYSAPGSSSMTSGCISVLGYDSSNPFFNYPKSITPDSTYATYYCDAYFWSSAQTNAPVISYVGNAYALYGAWHCYTAYSWSITHGVRLCYRPL